MFLRAVATFVCLWIVAACGPTAVGGELTWSACRDGIDNDLDGRIDCLDSDCRAVPCIGTDSGPAEAGVDANVADASSEECATACVAGEQCRNQRCQVVLPASLRIEVLSVDGPGRLDGLFSRCLDSAPEDCGLAGLELRCSGCLPDPYVRVDIEQPQRDGTVRTTTIGKTRPQYDTEFASWNDENRWDVDLNPVTLGPDDTIVLVEVDRDEAGDNPPDDPLFDCVMRARDLRIGAQRCISKPSFPSQAQKSEFEIEIDVRLAAP